MSFPRRLLSRRTALIPGLIALAVSGCAATNLSTAGTSSQPTLPAAVPPATLDIGSPSATPFGQASASAPAVQSAIPSGFVPPRSLGAQPWKVIHWTKVANSQLDAPAPPAAPSDADVQDQGWQIFGWSKGFEAIDEIDVLSSASSVVFSTAFSSDGINWKSGGTFSPNVDFDVTLSTVLDGPAGLVLFVEPSGACGARTVLPVAVSGDGLKWRAITPPEGAGGSIVSAGPAGYFGVWPAKTPPEVSVSGDGATWRSPSLTGAAFSGVSAIDSGVSFGGGFVISSETHGEQRDAACGPAYVALNAAIWYSADGKSWTKEVLPGGATEGDVSIDLIKVSNRLLLAAEDITEPGSSASDEPAADETASPRPEKILLWGSTNGRNWRAISIPWTVESSIVTNGQYGLFDDADGNVYSISSDFKATRLQQSGDVPKGFSLPGTAFGPNYLVYWDDSGNSYIGVLSSQ
jgi:hypothetical protein